MCQIKRASVARMSSSQPALKSSIISIEGPTSINMRLIWLSCRFSSCTRINQMRLCAQQVGHPLGSAPTKYLEKGNLRVHLDQVTL